MQEKARTEAGQQVSWLPMESIRMRKSPSERREDNASLAQLAASIRRDGLIQPISVLAVEAGKYEIISGNRRYLACKMAGMTHIEAVIRQSGGRRENGAALEMLEALSQGRLHYLDAADALRRLEDEHGMSAERIAEHLSCTPSQVEKRAALTGMGPELRALAVKSGMSERMAQALMRIPEEGLRMKTARQAAFDGLRVRDAELIAASCENRRRGHTTCLARDYRLYLNALRVVARQMDEAGVGAEVTERQEDGSVCFTVRFSSRHRRAARHQPSISSQAVQCVPNRSHSPIG